MKKLLVSLALICLATAFVQAQTLDNIKFELGMGEKKKGYYNTTQISLLMGNKEMQGTRYPYYYPGYYYGPLYYADPLGCYMPGPSYYYTTPPTTELKIIPSITMVNGYMFNEHWSAGIGLGIEVFEYMTYPVFAECKYTLWDKKISPYFTFKGGYSIADFKEKHYNEKKAIDFYPYEIYDGDVQNFGGLMINPEIGVKVNLSHSADLLISAGYRYQELKSKADKFYGGTPPSYDTWEEKQHLNRLVFGLAVQFK